MTVDGKPIFTIVSHKKVLVEQTIPGLEARGWVPVYREFDYESFIGLAHIYKVRNGIYADIHLLADVKGYPAIAYTQNTGKIYALGISVKRNIDKTINSL